MSKKIIAVFGATGAQGSSVLRALVNNGSYHIKAITRNANSEKGKQLSKIENCTVFEADLDNPKSLDDALKGCYGTFLVTDFASHIAKKEVQQGVNAIDSAIKNGVSHLVFSGLENVESILNKPCYHLDFKAEIENYGLKNSGKLNFTSVRLPAYFENFHQGMIHKLKPNQYLVNAPMDDKPMFGMSVDDIGEVVLSVLQNPQEYKSKLIGLASEKLKISEYVSILNKHLGPNQFIDSKMTTEKFGGLGFPGAEDLAVMFEYFQTGKMQRDINFTKKLNSNLLGFESWVIKNKQNILEKLN
jgi:nucleoside-diphosphate-sugar epimerase